MKTIIAGSRDFTDFETVARAIRDTRWEITEVVSGGAKGADALGELWAGKRGVPVKRFPADWNKHGRSAGPMRNRQMAEYAEALIAFWDGESRGTGNMIDEAKKRGLLVWVQIIA